MAEVQQKSNIDSNMVFVVGRIAKAPEVFTTGNDKKFVRIRLAVTCRGADKPTAWLDLSDWNNQRWENIGQYLTVGRQIAVQGSLTTYKAPMTPRGSDKEIEIDRVGINVQEIQLLQRPAGEMQDADPQPESPAAAAVAADVEAGVVAF